MALSTGAIIILGQQVIIISGAYNSFAAEQVLTMWNEEHLTQTGTVPANQIVLQLSASDRNYTWQNSLTPGVLYHMELRLAFSVSIQRFFHRNVIYFS